MVARLQRDQIAFRSVTSSDKWCQAHEENLVRTKEWNTEQVIGWMFRSGRLISDPKKFVENLGRQLIECGAPLWRIRLSCRTIHPQIAAWSVIWASDMDHATERQVGHGYKDNDAYMGSPMAHVIDTGTAFRRRLTDLDEEHDHQLMFELQSEGATDYLALPLIFSDGTTSSMIFVANREKGFCDSDVSKLTELVEFVAPVFEVFATRRIAGALLDTYVGRRTGERVLSGQIKRGDGEIIRAAIWFSDLRDFTPLTETLKPQELIALLNSYFEAVTAAVTARGGEVLRFIGDAMLIVFPVSESISLEDACGAAVDAATDAFDNLATLNFRRARSKLPTISFGVGLHVGEVIYGNVGAPDRLDFTVMGPAVNRTARLESLTKEAGYPLLMSDDFAETIDQDTVSLGFHALKGVAEPQEVFALDSMS